jgi:hypothetical protein
MYKIKGLRSWSNITRVLAKPQAAFPIHHSAFIIHHFFRMPHYEDLNTTKIALAGFIATVAVFAIILLMMVLFHLEMNTMDQTKVIDQRSVQFDSLVAEQKGQLAKYRWIDPEKKIVQIPISEAMRLVVEELRRPAQKSPPETHLPAKEGEHGT